LLGSKFVRQKALRSFNLVNHFVSFVVE
jgi:hypothetical protein